MTTPPDRNPAMQRAPTGSRIRLSTREQVHNRLVRIELACVNETALTRNLEIPIAICIMGIVYIGLLYSLIWYLE